MNTSFKKDKKDQTVVEAPEPSPEQLPARPQDVNEMAPSDLIVPRLNIVQAIGPMSENFIPGSLVYNGDVVLSQPPTDKSPAPAISLTVLKISKYYEENLEFGTAEWPQVFKTLEEVRAAGGHTEWVDNQKPPFSEAATATVMIQRPDNCDSEALPFEFEGKRYGIALWKMKGTAYTRGARLIFTAQQYALKADLAAGSWTLATARIKAGKNFVWAPVLKQGPKNSPELTTFLKGAMGDAK